MKKRLAFLAGDFLANAGVGVLSAAVAVSIVSPAWGMAVGMFVGMALGMIVALLCALFLVPLLGAHELMIPTMLAAMLSGMIAGMWATSGEVDIVTGVAAGGVIGVCTLCTTLAANAWMRSGKRR